MTKPKPCAAVRADGTPCKGRARPKTSTCLFHDPKAQAQVQAARLAGGQARADALKTEKAIAEAPSVSLKEKNEVLEVLGDTATKVRRGQMGPRTGHVIGYLCSVALKALEEHDSDKKLTELEKRVNALSGASADDLLKVVSAGKANGVDRAASGH